MDNNEVKRRIKLIEKHMQGECEIEYLTEDEDMSAWATLSNSNNVYYMLLMDGAEVREKPQDIECWANVYSDHRTYHPSEQSALDNVMPSAIRTAVHVKEVK